MLCGTKAYPKYDKLLFSQIHPFSLLRTIPRSRSSIGSSEPSESSGMVEIPAVIKRLDEFFGWPTFLPPPKHLRWHLRRDRRTVELRPVSE